ncbi:MULTISPECIES: MFS transporter [unclassified Bradyrhizobium]|uniref:MFS transporter n=1 Tax=unclassified Bradyrhizobium TaxID=2631580 RepID=UPI003393BADF
MKLTGGVASIRSAKVKLNDPNSVDLDQFVDDRPISAFHINLVIWPLITMIADGFDLVVMGFSAPEIINAFHIDRGSMGWILSASLIGMLIGTPIAGYLGDRFGRKPLVVAATLLFGAATWVTVFADTATHFFVLRFVAGLGLAGIIPNVTALVSESIPRASRGSLLVIVQLGVQVGALVPGLVAAYLVSKLGWPILFHVGGACPILLALALVFLLPESIKFLALDPKRRSKVLKMARAIDRNVAWDDATRIVQHVPDAKASLSPIVPYRNGMHAITPLLWALAAIGLFTNLLIASWAPTVLRDLGLVPASAALTVTFFALGGLVGSLVMTLVFSRYGFLAVAIFYLIAVPVIAAIGYVDRGRLPWLIFVAGICVSGTQSAINSAFGMLYPTPIRGNSIGWGMAIGRLGSIFGPLFGGFLMGRHVTGDQFFAIASVPIAIGICVAVVLTYLCRQRFHSWSLNDMPL